MFFESVGKKGKWALCLTLLSIGLAGAVLAGQSYEVHASAVAEVVAGSNDMTAVNLKEGDWVYSTYLDRNGVTYASVTGYNGMSISLEIPAALGGIPVRSVSREAFVGNRYVTEVTLSEGIHDIGKYAFQGCVGLRSVTLPSTLKQIGEGAFYGCQSLTALDVPDGVTKIGDFAFYQCHHLRTAKLSASLQSIGDGAFGRCAMLETVTFGDELESVGDEAFHSCTVLQSALLPSSLMSLGKGVFVNCRALREAAVGDNLEEIRSETFRGCTSLTGLSLGESVRVIGACAFEDCDSLVSVTVDDSAETIGTLAFGSCESLRSVTLGESVANIGFGAFNGCTALTQISVSENNTHFRSEGGLLYNRTGEQLMLCPQGYQGKVAVADGAVEVNDYAFFGCRRMTSAVLPDSVKKVGMASFLSCTDLITLFHSPAVDKIGCLSVGYYFKDGELKKAAYTNVLGESESVAEMYCAAHDVSFRSYRHSLMLNTEQVVLPEGDTFEIKTAFLSHKKAKLLWESSDSSVVQVKNGTLRGVAKGSAEVTVTAEGFEPRMVKVTVIKKSDMSSSQKKNYSTRFIYRGESEELSSLLDQIIDPLLAVDKFWYTSAPKVAIVGDDGKVTAVGKGNANITCRLPDGSENNFWVTVTDRPSEFALTELSQEIAIGDTVQIVNRLLPSKSSDPITWKSDNENIATVDKNGAVTAISQGSCEITATTASGLKDTVTVRCVIAAESLSIPMDTRSVYQGKEFNLSVELSVGSEERVIWRSSDPSIVSVNSKGKVTGVSFGTATVYAETASGGAKDSCVVNVMVKAEKLALDVKKLTLNAGDQHKLNALVFPSYSPETTEPCFWNTTDETVAVVDNDGMITAVSAGNCIINCKTDGGLISKCSVTVKLPAQAAEIAGETDSIYIGDVTQLKLRLNPQDTTDMVTWQSDDESVAKVTSQGSVKGRDAGTATITATVTNDVSGEQVTASYVIQVLKKAESVSLKRNNLSLHVGDADSLRYVIQPSDSNDVVTWSSGNEAVATVRDDGIITAVGEGTCYVYVKTGSGSSARCKIVVE